MTRVLWRVLPVDPRAPETAPGGAIWFPRQFQGSGRHDDPEQYGCLYVAEQPASAVAEALAPFRGTGRLDDVMLKRGGRQLVLVELEHGPGGLIDLDDPEVLAKEQLAPSTVATRHRAVTQAVARKLYAAHPRTHGLRWWSTLEASWINVTLFDRATPRLAVTAMTPLSRELPAVIDAAELLGLS